MYFYFQLEIAYVQIHCCLLSCFRGQYLFLTSGFRLCYSVKKKKTCKARYYASKSHIKKKIDVNKDTFSLSKYDLCALINAIALNVT